MDNQQASEKWFQDSASHAIHAEQLERVERFNGRAAMLGFVIGVLTEAITGQGIIHQIGLVLWWTAAPPAAPSSCHSVSDRFRICSLTPRVEGCQIADMARKRRKLSKEMEAEIAQPRKRWNSFRP